MLKPGVPFFIVDMVQILYCVEDFFPYDICNYFSFSSVLMGRMGISSGRLSTNGLQHRLCVPVSFCMERPIIGKNSRQFCIVNLML